MGLLGLLLIRPHRVWAYIMSTPRILRRTRSALMKINVHQVAGLGTGWRSDRRTSFEFGERWIFELRTQLDVNGPGGRKARWYTGGRVTGDPDLIPPQAVRTTMDIIFGHRDPVRWMKLNQVDQKKQRLALLDDRVCIVIGSDNSSLRLPQLWIDQDTFLPHRFICRDGLSLIDIKCIQWSGPISNGLFPHRLSIRLNGREIRRLEVSTVRQRSKASDAP